MKNFILIFLSNSLLISCSKTTYWTTDSCCIPDSPVPMELQITDTSFTTFHYSFGGCLISNHGLAETRKMRSSNDTLFVYELEYRPVNGDTTTYAFQEVISEVYLRKGKKLYPISWRNPKKWIDYYNDFDPKAPRFDPANLHIWEVDWGGNYRDTAYLYFGARYHQKGKYKEMRNILLDKMERGDTVFWDHYFPKQILTDSTYEREVIKNSYGPFKTNLNMIYYYYNYTF